MKSAHASDPFLGASNLPSQVRSASAFHHDASGACLTSTRSRARPTRIPSAPRTPVRRFTSSATTGAHRPVGESTSSFYRSPAAFCSDDDDDDDNEGHEADDDSTTRPPTAAARFGARIPPSRIPLSCRKARERREGVAYEFARSSFKTPERRNAGNACRVMSRSCPRPAGVGRAVEMDESIISQTPAKGENDAWLARLGFDIALLKLVGSDDEEKDKEQTGVEALDAGAENRDPNVMLKSASEVWTEDVVKVLRTESEDAPKASPHKSALSLFTSPAALSHEGETEGTENEHANSSSTSSLHEAHESDNETLVEETASPDKESEDPLDAVAPQTPTATVTQAPKMWEGFRVPELTPGRVTSAAGNRRRSARVSTRELSALLGPEKSAAVAQQVETNAFFNSAHKPKVRLSVAPGEGKGAGYGSVMANEGATGTNVLLSPVRPTREQRKVLGSDQLVTPVRRSLRISRRLAGAAHLTSLGERNEERLKSVDYAYIPNHSLQD